MRDQLSARRDRRTGTTTHYVYDSFDMLVRVETRDASGTEVEPPWQYAYDALGRRTEVRRGGYRRQFYWDGDRLAAEVMPNGALRVYEYAGHGALVPLAFTDYASADASPESGRHYTVFTDPVGQPLQIEDAKGQLVWFASRVDPYGHIEVHPASQLEYNLRWPGHYYDPETALHYNRYRYYDPGLGRYLQTDPLGYEGSPTNLYGYPANPLTDVDVLGLTHEARGTRSTRGRTGDSDGSEGTTGSPRPRRPAPPAAPDPADLHRPPPGPQRYAEMRADEINSMQRPGSSETFHVMVVDGPDGNGGTTRRVVITSSTDHQSAPEPIRLNPAHEEFRAPDPPRPMQLGPDGRPTRSPVPHPPNSTRHHAEQRGARSLRPGETVVASAPTRGCCAGCQNALGAMSPSGTPRSSGPSMHETIPDHRRDQGAYREYRRERSRTTGTPWTHPSSGSDE